MTRGYSFPTDPDSWEALCSEFEWDVPETYNIADAALRGGRTGDIALIHVDVDDERHEVTYGDLDRAVRETAAALAADGVDTGDRVALCLPQCPELVVGYLATFALGAVAVPLSMILGEDSVEHSLAHSGATTLLLDERKADELGPTCLSAVESTITVDTGADGYDDSAAGALPTAEGETRIADTRIADTRPDDPALVLYTSGTTGRPKGVVQGHQYLIGSSPAYQCYFHLFDPVQARESRVWSPSEWAWAGALFNVVFPTLAFGGAVVSRTRYSGFDPEAALRTVERTGVTHAFLPPTALRKIKEGADPAAYDLTSLSVAQCGGEKLSPSLHSWGEAALEMQINEAYGQTEANGLVGNCQALFDVRPGSIGRPYPGHDVVAVDADGETCEPGERGELAVRPPDPVLFEEYLGDPSATAEKYDDHGQFRTDDAAVVDDDGYVWHRGRMDDLIITSGYRVSPLEVESALEAVEWVGDAVVGGVPGEERGQRVKAYVTLREPTDVGERVRELREAVRERVGRHKAPHEITVVDSVPTTSSGKTDRAAMFGGGTASDGEAD